MSDVHVPSPRVEPAGSALALLGQAREAHDRVDAVRTLIDAETERAVRQLRLAQVSWATIGRALGVTRQAARQRWGYLDRVRIAVHRTPGGGGHYVCPETNVEWRSVEDLEHGAVESLSNVNALTTGRAGSLLPMLTAGT